MGLFDILLGKTRPARSKIEKLFAITTGQITLAATLNANPTGKAAICFKPMESSFFEAAETEVQQLLGVAGQETGSKINYAKDNFGFVWVLIEDREFEDLVASLHMVSLTLQEHGFGDQLLAAVLQFVDSEGKQFYWIYNYKRGNFYPFVPLPNRQRDNSHELRLRAVMEKELPIEPELERWYPLWDIPLG